MDEPNKRVAVDDAEIRRQLQEQRRRKKAQECQADGRPRVAKGNENDPLLEALIREHAKSK